MLLLSVPWVNNSEVHFTWLLRGPPVGLGPVALVTILIYLCPGFPLSLFHDWNTPIPYTTSQKELPAHKLFSLTLLSHKSLSQCLLLRKPNLREAVGSPCCSITEEQLRNRRQRMRKVPPSACLKCTPRCSVA